MRQPTVLINLLPAIPLLLVHLAGVVVAIILVVRLEERRLPAVLALIGFGLLFLLDLANFGRGPLITYYVQSPRAPLAPSFVDASVGCCCSIFEVVATTFLIVSIWQAVSSASVEETAG